MTTYKGTKGFKIQNLASDPPTPIAGQVWYNSTTYALKGALAGTVGAWSSGGAMNNGRSAAGGFGTQTSAFVIGGNLPAVTAEMETYNGSSWTVSPAALGAATTQVTAAGKGTATAGLSYGGGLPTATTNTESWNGTAWSEVNALNTARIFLGGVGVQGAALAISGLAPAGTSVEKWDGTSWTEVAEMNSGRLINQGACGLSTAALVAGGYLQPATAVSALVEVYNGTAWTEVADLATAKEKKTSFGIQTEAISVAGGPRTPSPTESFNGTAWSEVADMATPHSYMASGGSSGTAGVVAGGTGYPGTPDALTITEEWTIPDIAIKTVATS